MSYDLKITGGTIVDGTGSRGFFGDVAVKDGRIVAVGDCPDSAKETLSAEGAIVTPGFVDIHTHYDGQISWDPDMATLAPSSGSASSSARKARPSAASRCGCRSRRGPSA